MTWTVRVRTVNEDGTAQVIPAREIGCGGACQNCPGCAGGQPGLLTAENPIGAKPGELVTVTSRPGPVLKAAAVYLLPVALFFAGYFLGVHAWENGAGAACAGLALGAVAAAVYDRRTAGRQKTVYKITGYAGDALLRSQKKGDNDLD